MFRGYEIAVKPCLDCCEAVNMQQPRWHCGACSCCPAAAVDPVPVPADELAELNPDLDQRGLRRLQAFEQLLAEDDQACGYQDPEE